jgi:hypothetical protein
MGSVTSSVTLLSSVDCLERHLHHWIVYSDIVCLRRRLEGIRAPPERSLDTVQKPGTLVQCSSHEGSFVVSRAIRNRNSGRRSCGALTARRSFPEFWVWNREANARCYDVVDPAGEYSRFG